MPGERLLSGQTLGILGHCLVLLGEEGGLRLRVRFTRVSQPWDSQLFCSLGFMMSHPFPRKGPGSLKTVCHPGAGLRQGQHSVCTTDVPASDASPFCGSCRLLLWIPQNFCMCPFSEYTSCGFNLQMSPV